MNAIEYQNIMGAMATNWNIQLNKNTLDFWWRYIGDLDYNQASAAVQKLICTSEYPPNVAMLRRAYQEVGADQRQTIDAVSEINKAIQRYGRYNEMDAISYLGEVDPILSKIAKAIGWDNLCNSNPNYIRPELEKLFAESDKIRSDNERLPGEVMSQITEIRLTARRALIAKDEEE